MKIKKPFVIISILTVLVIGVLVFATSRNVSLPGTWVVAKYNLSGDTYSTDKIAEAMGETFAQYNSLQITFTPSGNVELISPTISQNENPKLATSIMKYQQDGNMVELYDDSQFAVLEQNGKYLYYSLSDDIQVIFEKR